MTAAQPHLPGHLLHANGAGVIALDILGPPAGVVPQCVLRPGGLCLHQKAQGRLQIARHPNSTGVPAPPGLVDLKQGLPQPVPRFRPGHRPGGKYRGRQQQRRVGAGEPHPIVLPWVLLRRLVVGGLLGPHQKGLPRPQIPLPLTDFTVTVAGEDVVNEIVVPDAGAPAVARRALLEPGIVHRQGQFRPVRRFERVFKIPCHMPAPPFFQLLGNSLSLFLEVCNKNP